MAAATAMADRHIVSLILRHLSDMKYKDRRQRGPDQPVELLEFRPTLVPSILVNKLWADEAISILWKRYPHLPALRTMQPNRMQWYASKVERLFIVSPLPDDTDDLAYLEALSWPSLRTLELEVDWKRHGNNLHSMMSATLEHIEILGEQSGSSQYIADVVLPSLLKPCTNLQSIHIGPDVISTEDPIHSQVLCDLLGATTSVIDVRVLNANFVGNNMLFDSLSKRPALQALEIDLDPGLELLSFLTGTKALFPALRRLHIKCYPETACALACHLPSVEQLSLDVARIPDQPTRDRNLNILDDLLSSVVRCGHLQLLKINIGQLATDFPTANSWPTLDGTSLVRLSIACPQLRDLTLLASEPAAIDGSKISSAQFEQFCERAPNLRSLSLKIHPRTAVDLEESVLQSLGKHCRQLEVLRLKIPLRLPSLTIQNNTSPVLASQGAWKAQVKQRGNIKQQSQRQSCDPDYVEIKAFAISTPASVEPLFPNLTHLALARPQSVLSVSSDNYAASFTSQSSSEVDPSLEEDLVRCWAHALVVHFSSLDILEAWADWTGQDNDSLNYFLPRSEPMASMWEFLSGIEQDLWEDGEEAETDDSSGLADNFENRFSFDSRCSGDWERASVVNEYPENDEYIDDKYFDTYEDEPEDMVTPVDERHAWWAHTNSKLTAETSFSDDSH